MDQFEYEINYPKEYGEWPCCKLFLQPFVENSILHGFENIERGGLIQISGHVEQDRFVIRVSDNGCGIRPEVGQALQSILEEGKSLKLAEAGSGIGIQNVVTRMRMYFGERFEHEWKLLRGKELVSPSGCPSRRRIEKRKFLIRGLCLYGGHKLQHA